MSSPHILFSPFHIKGLSLKNRITMAPLYMGYANQDGTVSTLLLDHYRRMAASGVALIVVENAIVDPTGAGTPSALRVDDDSLIPGLSRLASTIKDEGALAFQQINHAGKFAYVAEKAVPSPLQFGETIVKEMTLDEIDSTVEAFASAARRVKKAGFDGVEIHGGTGYLLVQFLSTRTNHRADAYGGSIENRMRFPLRVVDAVMERVGQDYPVGYRFLADEGLPDGLHPEETKILAMELEKRGVAYLSVMAGTYDSFFLPEWIEMERNEAYMAHYAGITKKSVPRTPIITAGRIQTPGTANRILEEGTADLVGLARVLLADPRWPKKAEGKVLEPIVACEPSCSLCMIRTAQLKPLFCTRWDKKRREELLARIGETEENPQQA